MELENTPETPARPNDAKALSDVLTCVSHMLHHDQIKPGARALINIMFAVEGYDSGDLLSFKDQIFHNFAGQPEPYESVLSGQLEECRVALWEADQGLDAEHSLALYDLQGQEPPFVEVKASDALSKFADKMFGAPAPFNEEEEEFNEYVLSPEQVKMICKAFDSHIAAKGEALTSEEYKEIRYLMECLA